MPAMFPLALGAAGPAVSHCPETIHLNVPHCRWGWFIVGCLFMGAIFVILYNDGGKYVAARDSSMVGFYNTLVLSLIVLWTAYPIVWAFAGEAPPSYSS